MIFLIVVAWLLSGLLSLYIFWKSYPKVGISLGFVLVSLIYGPLALLIAIIESLDKIELLKGK